MKQLPIDFAEIIDDFRRLNPNDVGTWPLIPRVAAQVGLFVVLLALGWFFVWDASLAELSNQEANEIKLKEEFLDKKRQAVNLDLYTSQLTEIDRSFGALLKQLPNRSEVDALLVEVNQSGLGRGLQFELFKPGAEQLRDFYAELPIAVKITGNYHDIGAFASDVAKLPRIVTLNNLSLAMTKDGSLSMDAVTRTFRYLDEEEVAAAKKAKAAQAAKAKGGKP